MMNTQTILFETGRFFVVRSAKKGFEVYQNGATAANRVAIIGYEGDKGLQRAKVEAIRRETECESIRRMSSTFSN